MSPSYRPLPYQTTTAQTSSNPIGFNNSTNARTATANQRQLNQGQGDVLMGQDQDLANQYRAASEGTQGYLNDVYDPMAQGNGGYNATEAANINYSPQEQQNLITGAGISAGVGNAAAVGAADRAANAAGGNPMALATYRARAAQTQGAQAGDAMTQARIAAKQAASQGAQTTGNARLAQQSQALGYYSGLQGQQNQNAQNEQGLQAQTYGTQANAGNNATADVLKGSQTPSTFDKITGAAAGAAPGIAAAFLADGYLDGGTDAVVGEDGPEAIVEKRGGYLADGDAPSSSGVSPVSVANSGPQQSSPSNYLSGLPGGGAYSVLPWITGALGSGASPVASMMADGGYSGGDGDEQADAPAAPQPSWQQRGANALKNYLSTPVKQSPMSGGDATQEWNKATPYSQMGKAIGSVANTVAHRPVKTASAFQPMPQSEDNSGYLSSPDNSTPVIGDGDSDVESIGGDGTAGLGGMMADGHPGVKVVTSPTRVKLAPGDSVIPLSYRPKAKVRPSVAMAAMQPRQQRPVYGGSHA